MREKIKKLPIAGTILICLGMVAGFEVMLNLLGGVVAVKLNLGDVCPYMNQMIAELIVAAFGVVMMLVLGYGKELKSAGIGWKKSFYVGGFLLGYICYVILAQAVVVASNVVITIQPAINIIVFLIAVILVGVAEEAVFRGVILNVLLDRMGGTRKGVTLAIVIDGVLFGCIHFINYFAGVQLTSVLVQVVTAAALGVLFAAVYARTGNIVHVMLMHTLVDFGALYAGAIFGEGDLISGINNISVASLVACPILLIPVIVLLWGDKKDEIGERIGAKEIASDVEQRNIRRADGAATTAFVLGICGIIFGFIGFGMGLNIVGLLAAGYAKSENTTNPGMAFAGKVTSVIGLVIAIVMSIAIIFVMKSGVMSI